MKKFVLIMSLMLGSANASEIDYSLFGDVEQYVGFHNDCIDILRELMLPDAGSNAAAYNLCMSKQYMNLAEPYIEDLNREEVE